MQCSQLQESAALTPDPPAIRAATFSLRLHLGKAAPLCKERDCARQFKALHTALFQQGQQQDDTDSSSLLQHVQCHRSCSAAEARGRGGYVDVLLHAADAAVVAAQQCVHGGSLHVGTHRVPVSWAAAAQPADTVRVLVMNPPLQFARQGFTQCLLTAAGYEGLQVMHEQLGHSRVSGDAAMRIPCADSILAYVQAPEDDPILCQLPDIFQVTDRPGLPCTVYVDGRTAQQPQLWQQEQQQQSRVRQRGRQLQQERILCMQQQEQIIHNTQAQVRAAWTQRQQRPASQQQHLDDAVMEDAPGLTSTPQQQQQQQQPAAGQAAGQAAAAAAVAAAFPGAQQQGGTAAALPADPFVQGAAGPQPAAAALLSYEAWCGDVEAEYLCTHAEDLGGELTRGQQDAMLHDFWADHPGGTQSESVDMQWLRRYFSGAAAASYGAGDWDTEEGEEAGAAGTAAGASSDAVGGSRDQQQAPASAGLGAAAHAAAPPGRKQQRERAAGGDAADAGAAALPQAAPSAAADVAAAPQVLRRSNRQRKAPDPVFAANVNEFAALSQQQQQQKRQQQQPTAATQPDTPPQHPRPRGGRAS